MTDVHGNLPALESVLKKIHQEGFDLLVHTGDVVSIGPHPRECLELLLEEKNIRFIMGNHDALFAEGLPEIKPEGMDDAHFFHESWTHRELGPDLRNAVSRWPYEWTLEQGGKRFSFLHYPYLSGFQFIPIIAEPSAFSLDPVFSANADLYFYGHDHRASDIQGRARYLNPGSLGCSETPSARYLMVTISTRSVLIEPRQVPYDDVPLFQAFESKQVPEKEFIYKRFFGGRFSGGRSQ